VSHRLTIRLDDEAWDTLQRVSEVTGVTMTAFVQAMVAIVRSEWTDNDWHDPREWPESRVRDLVVSTVDVARKIDADRRRRR
jgi:hypothetical protein